jgi:hypothetical protein
MTQVSINPNTRNVLGDDRALYLQDLEAQDPNAFKALSNLVVDLTDAQEYVDNQPIKDLTKPKDPGQVDASLSGDITPSFSSGSGVSAGSGRNLLLDFFFKTPQGLAMGIEDLASMAGIASEFFTMSTSQRYGYAGDQWRAKYTKPAVEAVKQLAPVAVKGYLSYLNPTVENLPDRAASGNLINQMYEGVKEGVHERGAASLVEPMELAFPIVGKTAKILSGKSTAMSPSDLRKNYWDEDLDDVNKRLEARKNRRDELFAEQQVEEDYYNRFEVLKSELAEGMGKDITSWKEDVDLPVELEAGNYKRGGAFEDQWQGGRSVEDIEDDLFIVYEDWNNNLSARGGKGRMPKPIGELARESLFKDMPEGYRKFHEDKARYDELDAEQRDILGLPLYISSRTAITKRLDSVQNEMGTLGAKLANDYPESFSDLESVENRLHTINAKIWDAKNELEAAVHLSTFPHHSQKAAGDPSPWTGQVVTQDQVDNLQATVDGLEVDRADLLEQKLSFPVMREEFMARVAELDTYDKETLAVIDRAIGQGWYALGHHGSRGDIRYFASDLRGSGAGGGDTKEAFFFAKDTETIGTYQTGNLSAGMRKRPDVQKMVDELDRQSIDANSKLGESKRDIELGLVNNYLEDIDYTDLNKSTRNIRDFFDRDLETHANIRSRSDDTGTYRKASDWPKNVDKVEQNLHSFFRLFRTDKKPKPQSFTELELGKLGLSHDDVKQGVSFTVDLDVLEDKFPGADDALSASIDISDKYDYGMLVGGKEIEIPASVITTMESLDWFGFDNPVDALAVAFDMRNTRFDRSVIDNYNLTPGQFPGSISDDHADALRALAITFSNTSVKLNSLRKLRQKDSAFESLPLSKDLKNIIPRIGSLSEYGNVSVLAPNAYNKNLQLTNQGITFTGDRIKANLNYFIDELDAYKTLPNRSPVDFDGVPIFKEQLDGRLTPLALMQKNNSYTSDINFMQKLDAWRVLSPEQKDKFADLLAAQYNESAKVTTAVDTQLGIDVEDAMKHPLIDLPPYKDSDGLVTAEWTNSDHPMVIQSRNGYVSPELIETYKNARDEHDTINKARNWTELHGGTNSTKVRINMQDPFILDMNGGHYDGGSYEDAIRKAKAAGNDGVIVRNVQDGGGSATDVYLVFDTRQIRGMGAMYDPRDAPMPKGVVKEYSDKYNKLLDERQEPLRRVIELSDQRSRQSSLGLDDDFSAIDSKLAVLNLRLREIGNSSFEMYGLKSGVTQENMDILLAERAIKYQELDRLKEEIKLSQGIVDSNAQKDFFDEDATESVKIAEEHRQNILAFLELKKELNLSDGSIDLGLDTNDLTFVVPNSWDSVDPSKFFSEEMLPTKDIMASWSGLAVPLGIGGAAHAFLANDAEAQDELEAEIIPDDDLTAEIGNVLDTFDIPGLDSPEAKEKFILRNKDWGYRISDKDKKRSKDLQKINLWRKKELGGNDL